MFFDWWSDILLKKGFTLVELVVVIAVLAIVAGIAIPRLKVANSMARGSKIVADLNNCESSINIYYARNGKFPDNSSAFVGDSLSSWPEAPIGKAIITKNNGEELELDIKTRNYVYNKPDDSSELNARIGRVTLGGKTIEDLLTTTASSLILNDE